MKEEKDTVSIQNESIRGKYEPNASLAEMLKINNFQRLIQKSQ